MWEEGEVGIFSPFQFVLEVSSSCLKGHVVVPEVKIIIELSGNIIAP